MLVDEVRAGGNVKKSNYVWGGDVRGLKGALLQSDSNYFNVISSNGTVSEQPYLSFENKSDLTGIAGEFYIGRHLAGQQWDLVLGGSVVEADTTASINFIDDNLTSSSDYLQLSSPAASETVAFRWQQNNQFDQLNVNYSNQFNRIDGLLGIRTHLFGEITGRRDDHAVEKISPLLFVNFGNVGIDETLTGFTDPGAFGPQGTTVPGIAYGYSSQVDSSFYGLGIGIDARGTVTEVAGFRIGYFAKARGQFELHRFGATSSFFARNINGAQSIVYNTAPGNCGLGGIDCASNVRLEGTDTAYSALLELGLDLPLTKNVNLEFGGRYRHVEAPKLLIDGVNDARVEFNAAQELSAFVGLAMAF